MRDTDDALDGNLAGPFICLHNHLLMLAYTHSQTRYLADFSASMLICFQGFTCSKDFKLKEVQNVFSQTPVKVCHVHHTFDACVMLCNILNAGRAGTVNTLDLLLSTTTKHFEGAHLKS